MIEEVTVKVDVPAIMMEEAAPQVGSLTKVIQQLGCPLSCTSYIQTVCCGCAQPRTQTAALPLQHHAPPPPAESAPSHPHPDHFPAVCERRQHARP